MEIKDKVCILLTATINVGGIPYMKRDDPKLRLEDYKQALSRWLDNPHVEQIVFCENSGYSSKDIENLVQSRSRDSSVEILSYHGQSFPRHLGKGYGELLTLKYMLENSKSLASCAKFIKVNGRYYVKNISKIIRYFREKPNVYVYANLYKNLSWADSRVFGGSPEFLERYLVPFLDLINDSEGYYLEHALARACHLAISDGKDWLPLPYYPIIIGYSGTSGLYYESSKIKSFLRLVFHRIKLYAFSK